MNRIEYINKINTYAARFVLKVEGFNGSNLYDINMHAEGFLIPILNEVFKSSKYRRSPLSKR
ncbi:MAG: SMEK domain-containing protein [Chitinophagaceae bacterium]